MSKHRLIDLIPAEELEEKLRYGDSELDYEFLCYEQNYAPLAEMLPKSMVIVDLGCYQAAQCYFFTDFQQYVGVDDYDIWISPIYTPPLRFVAENTVHARMSIQDFISKMLVNYDLDNTYFVMSAVSDHDAASAVFDTVKHCLIAYPGMDTLAKGILADEIRRRISRNNCSMETTMKFLNETHAEQWADAIRLTDVLRDDDTVSIDFAAPLYILTGIPGLYFRIKKYLHDEEIDFEEMLTLRLSRGERILVELAGNLHSGQWFRQYTPIDIVACCDPAMIQLAANAIAMSVSGGAVNINTAFDDLEIPLLTIWRMFNEENSDTV